MSRTLPVLFACIAAAGCDRAPVRIDIAASAARAAPRAVPGTPHGAVVEVVAVTEAGDVALTADAVGMLRLWPALDGSRQAIPIAAMAPSALALATSGDELIAAVVDQARAVWVLRLGREGTIRGRAQLPNDLAARQVIAAGADLLVLRADESIERYDGSGTRRGRIVAPPGERIGSIAARGGAAIASIVSGDATDALSVRWIELGDELAWGDELALPSAIVPAPIALAPGRHRLAVAVPNAARAMPEPTHSASLAVFEIRGTIKPYALPGIDVAPGVVIGFTDDDQVAVEAPGLTSWWRAAPHDPWKSAGDRTLGVAFTVRRLGAGAIGDRVALAGYAAGLELANGETTRYLGWGMLLFGNVSTLRDRILAGPADGKLVWLDDRLAEVKTVVQDKLHQPAPQLVVPLDEQHVVIGYGDGERTTVELVDMAHLEKTVKLGAYAEVDRVAYEPSLGVVAIATASRIERFRVGIAPLAAERLPALAHTGGTSDLRLLDPARADGVAAIAVGYDDEGMVVSTFRAGATSASSRRGVAGAVLAIDDAGTVYEKLAAHPLQIVMRRGDRDAGRIDLDTAADSIAVSHDGASVALRRTGEVAVVGTDGTPRWRHPMFAPFTVAFTGDDHRVIVRTGTGLIALDATTGAELSRTCGWEFGLHDTPLPSLTYGLAPVCEDDEP